MDAMPRWAGRPSTTVTRGWSFVVRACISIMSFIDVSKVVGGSVGGEVKSGEVGLWVGADDDDDGASSRREECTVVVEESPAVLVSYWGAVENPPSSSSSSVAPADAIVPSLHRPDAQALPTAVGISTTAAATTTHARIVRSRLRCPARASNASASLAKPVRATMRRKAVMAFLMSKCCEEGTDDGAWRLNESVKGLTILGHDDEITCHDPRTVDRTWLGP
jgi:hypothetical protein